MNPPELWWSDELASEAGDDPLGGLITSDFGLFCFQLRSWAKLAELPPDAVQLVVPDTEDAVLAAHRQTGRPDGSWGCACGWVQDKPHAEHVADMVAAVHGAAT